jgi:branched-chain amino acid transport system ATP-binding protein
MTSTAMTASETVTPHSIALKCDEVAAGHNGVAYIRGFDLTLAAGKVLALVGPNGAGKTTLLLTLAGLLPRLNGSVEVNGLSLRSGNPHEAAKAGLVLVPDDRALFTGLTTAENLEVARMSGGPSGRSMLELFPALEARWDVAAGNLSGGEQQMLAVARGLMRQPKVLLIDELSMGLAPVIVESVLLAVRRIADDYGAAVVLVEQHIHLALEIADEAMVLVHGDVVMQGNASELAENPSRIEAAYLGSSTERGKQ